MDPLNTMSLALGIVNRCGAFTSLSFFVAGIVGLALVEFLLVLYLYNRLLNISSKPLASPVSDLTTESEDNSISVEGKAWVAPLPDHLDLSKAIMRQIRKDKDKDKDGHRDSSRRGEDIKVELEIAPVRMQAKLKGGTLSLVAADGTVENISLQGCEVLAVSSTPGPQRKWGKKFPIKLHHPDRHLYRGSKTLLFFSESGYAKEAWCEAFRVMAKTDLSLSDWTFRTKRKYREYTRVAEENMPYLTKFYATDEVRHLDVKQMEEPKGQFRRRMLWKGFNLARKGSLGKDYKESKSAEESHQRKEARSHKHDDQDRKSKDTAIVDKDHRVTVAETSSRVDPIFDRSTNFEGLASGEVSVSVGEGNIFAPTSAQKDNRESHDQVPATQQSAHETKEERAGKETEQGVLCLNMFVARLYFDFNQNEQRLASVERFFLRLLMRIRVPSYMKSLSIKEIDLGRNPPFATAIRMVPPDAEGALAVEVDMGWRGGGHVACETRLDLREHSAQEKVVNQLAGSGSERDAAAALVSGMREDFDVSSSGSFSTAVQEERPPGDEGSSNKRGRIMSMMSRVADRVSQVPLVLKIRLVSLKGTAVFKLKAPPSDRVWFAFKTMPEVHFEPVPCIGDHRISSSALGNLIAQQMKVQIRETLVLPYCEDLLLDWMVADKNNWLPTSAFPLPFFDSQLTKAERKLFKRKAEEKSSSSDDNGRPDHQSHSRSQNTSSGQSRPPKAEAFQGSSKPQKHAPFSHTNSYQPSTTQESNHGILHPRRCSSDLLSPKSSSLKPSRSASAEHLNSQSSVSKRPRTSIRAQLSALLTDPVQASGSTALSLTSPLIAKESIPVLNYDVSHKEEILGSAGDSELGTSSLAMDSSSKDYASHSESESDVQFVATGAQVAKPEEVNESVHVVPRKRREKMLSLGRRVGSKLLDEGRRNIVDKLHHKRPDDSDGSAHSQASGRWAPST